MNPRLLSQPLSPTPAKGSASRPLRTLGLAAFLALFALLLWGEAAHADDAVDGGPPSSGAPAATSADGPDALPTEDAPPTEEAPPADQATTPDTPAPVVAAQPDEPTIVVVEAVQAPSPADDVASEGSPQGFESGNGVTLRTMRELPRLRVAAIVKPSVVTFQAHAAPAVHQCNADTYPTGAGWEATCTVTVENTLGSDGSTHSRVTTTSCLAEAGVLPPEGCTTSIDTSNSLVTSVDQCNGILAGGSNVTCSVEVVNNVPFGTPTTGVTVNQCIGSGQGGVSPGGPPTDCDPVDSSTSGATVTQCNGSANGGGAPERVQCGVTGGATALPVTVNQCNGSTAAGSTVTCNVTYTNNFAATTTGPGDSPIAAPTPTPGETPSPAPIVPISSETPAPAASDVTDTVRRRPAGSSTLSARPLTGPSSGADTSLAATGPATSITGLLLAALVLLLLGSLLLARSTPTARH